MRNIRTIKAELVRVNKQIDQGKHTSMRDLEEAKAIEQTLRWVLGDDTTYAPGTWAEIRRLSHENTRRKR